MSLQRSVATAAGSTARPPFGTLMCATSPVSSGESTLGVKYGVFTAYFFRGIATLTLAMTRKFNCLCEGSEATKQTPGRVEVYGI